MVTTSRMSAQVGRVLGGRYRLVAPVGVGASAEVYLADDVELGRQVAVKVLHEVLASEPTFLRRFQAEARAAAALNHPNIVAIHDVGDDGTPYLVTEYLAGGSLRSVLDRGTRLSVAQAGQVGVQTARGLAHAHGAGIVHRDIKPANLLFDLDGRLRIGDFGLARALAEVALTEFDGSPLGTARYACPEQVRGEPVGPTGDVYALALVLVEIVDGAAAFGADSALASLVRRTEEPIPVPPTLGPLAPVLEAAGRVDPGLRPRAAEFATALLSASASLERAGPVELSGPAPIVLADPTVSVPFATAAEPATDGLATGGFTSDEPVSQESVSREPVSHESGPVLFDQEVAEITPLPIDLAPTAEDAVGGDAVDVDRRRRWPILLVVLATLAAAAAAGAFFVIATPATHTVPDLVGESVDDLDGLVGDYGWEISEEQTRADGTVAGEILGQNPPAGTDLAEGEALALTVSLGPPLVDVPTDLVGLPIDQASDQLESVGLVVGEVTRQHDEEAPVDVVLAIDETIAGAGQTPKGTAVPLVVSDGPAPRPIPEVAGRSWDEIAAEFEGLGLVPVRVEESSREVAEGLGIQSEPAAGTEVERGAEVSVVVSTGPPWIELRDVSGLTPAEAADALESDRIVVAGVVGPPNRPVASTDPVAGTLIQEGSSVSLVTSG